MECRSCRQDAQPGSRVRTYTLAVPCSAYVGPHDDGTFGGTFSGNLLCAMQITVDIEVDRILQVTWDAHVYYHCQSVIVM